MIMWRNYWRWSIVMSIEQKYRLITVAKSSGFSRPRFLTRLVESRGHARTAGTQLWMLKFYSNGSRLSRKVNVLCNINWSLYGKNVWLKVSYIITRNSVDWHKYSPPLSGECKSVTLHESSISGRFSQSCIQRRRSLLSNEHIHVNIVHELTYCPSIHQHDKHDQTML